MSKKHHSLRFVVSIITIMAITGLVFAGSSGKYSFFNIFTSQAEETTAPQTESLPEAVIGTCDTAGPVEVEATAGMPGPTAYGTLKLAFDAINAGTHQGVINIEVCGNTVEGTTPATLNSTGAGSAVYTSISIRPLADGLSINGNPATGFGVIQLKGADNVTIDGDNPNSGGTNRNLTVNNTNTTTDIAGSVIRIATAATVVTSADNITLRNMNLNGNVTLGNAAAITSTTGSSNSSFGIYAGGNGGTTATDAPTAITSVTTNTAPSGTTINNLTIDNNTVNQCARGIVFVGAATTVSTGVAITNNIIGGSGVLAGAPPYVAPATTVYTKGIYISGTNAVTITGNTLQNILSYVATTMNGIELQSLIGAGGVTINSNTITGVVNNGTSAANGIALTASLSNPTVNGNTISNVQAVGGATVAGIILNHSLTAGSAQRNKVTTVYSRGTGGFGSYGINVNSGSAWTIRNNMVSDVNAFLNNASISTSFGPHGIRVVTGTGHLIQNNSVNLFGAFVGSSSLSMSSALTLISTTSTGMEVRNNILVNTMTGAPVGTPVDCIYLPAALTSSFNLTDNNNDYFSSSQLAQQGTTAVSGFTIADFDASTTAGATNWRNYTSTLLAANTNNDNASIKTDPLFVSATDLHLTAGSPARNVGAIIAAVTDDIDNQARPGGNAFYDIGADEFDGTAPPVNDMSATAFISPVNGSTVATGVAFAPQASFTNVGTATQTSVPVRYRVLDAGMMVVCNVTGTIPSISFTQTVTVTFPTCTIASVGTYTIKATSELVGDTNSANNEITGTLNAIAPLSGSYNVGTGEAFTSLTNTGGIFDALNAAGATSNITINITSDLTGESGSVALNQLAGGFTVTIKPSGAARTITSTATAVSVIKLNDADNVTIDGSLSGGTDRSLSITNTNAAASTAVIWVASATNGAQSNTIKNVNLTGGNDQNVTNVFNFAIIASSSASILTGGTDLDNNTYTNNFIKKVNVGIISIGGLATNMNQNTTISNNLIGPAAFGSDQIGTLGMLIFNENAPQITGNDIRFIGSALTTGGSAGRDHTGISLCTGSASWSGSTAPGIVGNVTNANVSRNLVHDILELGTFSAAGIVENCSNAAPTLNTIANNMIYNISANGTSGDQTVGIGIANGSGDTVAYNSVNLSGDTDPGTATSSTTGSFGISVAFATPTNLTLKNNISAVDLSSNTLTVLHAAVNLQSATFNFGTGGANNNDYFINPMNTQARIAATGGTAGTYYTTLAAYQAAVTPQEVNSVSLNPTFVSATDLHLQSTSPVIGLATPIAGLTTDFDGQTRDATTPDIGADEFIVLVPGVLQFSSATYNVAENVMGGTVTLTVNRTGGSDGAVSVNYTLANGTATGGAACGGMVDFVNTGGTVSFANGETSKTFTVAICDDAVFEGNEDFTSTLSNPTGGATIGMPATATVTINDNEVAAPGSLAFSSATYSVAENVAGGTVTLTVSRTGGSDGAVSVNYTLANGTATGGAACGGAVDFVNTGGTVMFANGETSKTFTVGICDDAVFEGNETFTSMLSGATGGATIGSPSTATVTINDNEVAQPGSLQFSNATYSGGEAGSPFTVTVTRTGGSDGAVSVNYATSDGTATGSVACVGSADYVSSSGTLNFANGETSKTFNVTICNDSLDEANETINYTLSMPTGGATIGTPNPAVQTIVDDDPTPSLSINDVSLNEGNAGTSNFAFTVTLSAASGQTVMVHYQTADGTATTANNDYVAIPDTTLTFMPGETTKMFNVVVNGDTTVEPNETFFVNLTMPTNATISDNQGQGTIQNDDAVSNFTVAISDARLTEGNMGMTNMVFNVTLTAVSPPTLEELGGTIASVQYATANGTATAPSDYTMTSGTLNFSSTGTLTVSVPIIGDTAKEANEFFFVNLSSPSMNTTITDNQGAGIIVDEDRPYVADFDRDLKADYSVFRPSTGEWYVLQSSNSMFTITSAGPSGMTAVPGDYDGDGKTDAAVWQASSGTWFVLQSSNSAIITTSWGVSGDKPVQGDYDGDGKTDIAVFRPSTGTWWVIRSSNSTSFAVPFGINTDKPVQGDYDGDAKTDIAVYRNGVWYILQSSTNSVLTQNWGNATDKPVSGDFDGDGRFDLAIYRSGVWWIVNSLSGASSVINFGLSTDTPTPADYDGDGTTDVAVYRSSEGNWFVLRSSNQTLTGVKWGISTDVPIPAAYIPQ